MEKILVHVCCGPCALGTLPFLADLEATGFFYNPNIYPETEHDRRLGTARIVFDEHRLP
jgi:predicted adenine nucleotide alpha hydrolase (AANH) superfamily ATPase